MKNDIIEAGDNQPPAIQDEPNLMQMIYQAAKDPDFDADKMQVIVSMKNDMDDREAKKAFNSALVEFKKNPPRIIKNAAGHTNKYATIDSVARQLDPELFKFGLAFRLRTTKAEDNAVGVFCVLSHADGYSEESYMESAPDKSGTMNAIQGKGSTITYLKRYTLLAALGLAEQGEDDDGISAHMKKAVDETQVNTLQELIEKAETTAQKVCNSFKAGSLSELSNEQYGAAVSMLNTKIARLTDANS